MSQIYTVTHRQVITNYASLQLLEPHDIAPGDTVTVASVNATFNGARVVAATPEYLFIGVSDEGDLLYDYEIIIPYQIIYSLTTADVARVASSGTVTSGVTACTWITAGNIEDWIGIDTATAGDAAFLTTCAAASNAFCFNRRKIAGYQDALATVPSQDVFLGTVQYGGMLYRQRGSIDIYASFTDAGSGPVTGLSGVIKQLLGIDRPTFG